MSPQEIAAENQKLLARRASGIGPGSNSLRPISPAPESASETDVNAQLQAYFDAVRRDRPTGNEQVVITGRRDLWDAFDDEAHPRLADACGAVARWYNNRLPQGGALILNGGYGCGKTHLARAVAELYGPYAYFTDELDLFERLRASYGRGGEETEYRLLNQLSRAKLLVFDDLGAYQTDNLPWVQNIYRSVFDFRCRSDLAFIITTNLSLKASPGCPSEFEDRLGGRNYSRVMGAVGSAEYYINLFGVPDYRLRGFR
jgi:DNA replication protein DnaC